MQSLSDTMLTRFLAWKSANTLSANPPLGFPGWNGKPLFGTIALSFAVILPKY